ncbi:MAG: hypothetical protein AB2A00_29920 [Myxococcota bacterium]
MSSSSSWPATFPGSFSQRTVEVIRADYDLWWWDDPDIDDDQVRGVAVDLEGNSYELRPGTLIKRNLDGARLWTVNFEPTEHVNALLALPGGTLLLGGAVVPPAGPVRPLLREVSQADRSIQWDAEVELEGGLASMALDGLGNLFIVADGMLRRYSPERTVSWTIPKPQVLPTLDGVVGEASGGVYAYSDNNDSVARLDLSGETLWSAEFPHNWVVYRRFASDPNGGFFYAVTHETDFTHVLDLHHYSPSGERVSWWAWSDLPSYINTNVTGLDTDAQGRVYIMGHTSAGHFGQGSAEVIFLARLSAPWTTDFHGPAGGYMSWSMAVDPSGTFLYALVGFSNQDIRGADLLKRYDDTGAEVWVDCLYFPYQDAVLGGLARNAMGHTVMAVSHGIEEPVEPNTCPPPASPRLREYAPTGIHVRTVPIDTEFSTITTGPDNSFYGAIHTNTVQRRSATDGALMWAQPLVPAFGSPKVMIDADGAGNLYAVLTSDRDDGPFTSVVQYTPDGTRTWHMVPSSVERAMALRALRTSGVAVGFREGLVVLDAQGAERWRNTSTTWLIEVDGAGDLYTLSWELKEDASGQLVLDDNGAVIWEQTFRKLSGDTGTVLWRSAFEAPSPTMYPVGLAVDAAGFMRVACTERLYDPRTQQYSDGRVTILQWDGFTGTPLGALPTVTDLGLVDVKAVQADPFGNVFVAGTGTQDPTLPGQEAHAYAPYLAVFGWQ